MLSSAGGCFCAWLALLPLLLLPLLLLLLLLLLPLPPPLLVALSPSWFLCQASLWPSALTPPLLPALGAPPARALAVEVEAEAEAEAEVEVEVEVVAVVAV